MSDSSIGSFPETGHDHASCVEDALSAAEKYCRANRLRWTPLRARVLEIIWGRHGPLGAYDILETLTAERLAADGREHSKGRVAPPTVYRTLDFLIEHGFAHRVDSLNAYVGCGQIGKSHKSYFLICTHCGNAAEIVDRGLSEALKGCADKAGFEVDREVIEISGRCPACQIKLAD
jgi:Fur family zinc uptake transcriptional regulator